MKYSLGISNFLKEIPGLSHSIVFLYFFALIAEEDFLIFRCYSLELCIQMLISFLFYLFFAFLLFTAICSSEIYIYISQKSIHTYIYQNFVIHLFIEGYYYFISISWLLWTKLHWTWDWSFLFLISFPFDISTGVSLLSIFRTIVSNSLSGNFWFSIFRGPATESLLYSFYWVTFPWLLWSL